MGATKTDIRDVSRQDGANMQTKLPCAPCRDAVYSDLRSGASIAGQYHTPEAALRQALQQALPAALLPALWLVSLLPDQQQGPAPARRQGLQQRLQAERVVACMWEGKVVQGHAAEAKSTSAYVVI